MRYGSQLIVCLVVCVGFAVNAFASSLEFDVVYTGSELRNLADASFPTRGPTVNGTGLRFGRSYATPRNEVLLRLDLYEPGELQPTDLPLRLTALADFTRFSADWDARVALWDRSFAAGGGLDDVWGTSTGGGIHACAGSSDGIHLTTCADASGKSAGTIAAYGQSSPLELQFDLSPGATTIGLYGAGTSLSYSTAALDVENGLSLLFFMDEDWEQIQINSLVVTAVPEPTTALLVGLGLIGLGVRRR